MNNPNCTCAGLSIIVGLSCVNTALATSTGLQSLGPHTIATDVFKFTCPASPPKTVSAQAKVEDIKPPINENAVIRVKLLKDHRVSVAEDLNPPVDSGEGSASPPSSTSPSPTAILSRGPGNYLVLFYKTEPGGDVFRGTVDCKRSNGTLFNPVLLKTQNE